MAYFDYYLCDICGDKAFYDRNLDYNEDKINKNTGYPQLGYVGDMKVICEYCAKENKIVIVKRWIKNDSIC